MQQLPGIEKTDSKEEISCLKWTKYNGRRNLCVNFQTDTDKLNIAVFRYRNKVYLKDNEVEINRIPVTSGKTSLPLELQWHILKAVHCTGWNNYS